MKWNEHWNRPTWCAWRKGNFFFVLKGGKTLSVRLMAGGLLELLSHFSWLPFFPSQSPTLISHLEVNCEFNLQLLCSVLKEVKEKISEVCTASVACGLQRHSSWLLLIFFCAFPRNHVRIIFYLSFYTLSLAGLSKIIISGNKKQTNDSW